MSHHLSGPNLRSPAGDARLDLTDVFAFPAPGGYRTVLIMNVNPDFGGFADAFHPGAVYRIDVDTDADDRADVAFSIVFSDPADGAQTFTVYRATGEQARAPEAAGEAIITGAPVSFGPEPQVVRAGPYRGFAGRRSDPFFADLTGILDRGGQPSLTAFFNPETAKDVYNAGEPADDWDTWAKAWTAVLDARLAMLTNGKVPGDHIGPHTDLLPDFPYLGNPHGRTS
jgi:hypothetical protein